MVALWLYIFFVSFSWQFVFTSPFTTFRNAVWSLHLESMEAINTPIIWVKKLRLWKVKCYTHCPLTIEQQICVHYPLFLWAFHTVYVQYYCYKIYELSYNGVLVLQDEFNDLIWRVPYCSYGWSKHNSSGIHADTLLMLFSVWMQV